MSRRTGIVAAGAAALVLAGGSAAGAASGGSAPEVVNRETVVAQLHSDGGLDVARLLSQLSVTGKGTVEVADPTESKGLRNLDGFGNPKVKDGKALYSITVDGSTSRRTVSDFTKALPVTVKASYRLDGREVRAQDVVGKDGLLETTYHVTNVSGVPTEISYKDGKGVTRTATVDLVLPLLGQLSIDLPKSFSDLATPTADVAGDGRGGSLVSYTMVLFEPLGAPTQTFTWSARVKDAELPPATIELVPVSTDNTSVATGKKSYSGGAAKAGELTVGAGQIDGHLLELQQGAGELLAGLT
jgi:putative membrane protein